MLEIYHHRGKRGKEQAVQPLTVPAAAETLGDGGGWMETVMGHGVDRRGGEGAGFGVYK